MNVSHPRRYDYYLLLAFAFTAVASIALQSLIWVSIALFFFIHYQDREPINWPSNLFTISTLIFLATFLIGALAGINPAKSFLTLHKYLTFLVLFPLGAMTLSLMDIRKLLHFFIAGATVCAIDGIAKHFLLNQDRIESFSGDKMVFGGMLMVSLLLLVILLKNDLKNYLLWACLPILSVALVLTETRGAWVGFLAGFLLLTWHLNRKLLLAGLLLIACSYFFLPAQIQDRVKSIGRFQIDYNHTTHKVEYASQTRFLIWFSGLNIIKDHPWGVGQNNLEDIYPTYRMPDPNLEPTVPHLHNNFLQLCVQNGWLGLLAYLFWIFSYYRTMLKLRTADLFAQDLNWTFICIFTAILFWGLTEYTFSHQFMNIQFFFLGLQLCLARAARKRIS